MTDYSFLATGLSNAPQDDLESMLHVQAAVMVFLDDAMAFGHLLQCCWAFNEGDMLAAEQFAKKHALVALKVKAVRGMEIDEEKKNRIREYVGRIRRCGGPSRVLDQIGAVVEESCHNMQPRYDKIEEQVEHVAAPQRQNILQAAYDAAANEYSQWKPESVVQVAMQSAITLLEDVLSAD